MGTPKISYSGKIDFSDAVSHAKTMNSYELGVFTNRLFDQTDRVKGDNSNAYYKYSDEELQAMKGLNYNWLDKAWDPAVSHRHSLTVNGGSDKVTYFAGVNFQDQGSNLGKVQSYNKWSFRAGGDVIKLLVLQIHKMRVGTIYECFQLPVDIHKINRAC